MGTCPRSNEKIKLFQSLLSKKYHHFWFLVKKVKLKYVSVYLCIYVSTYVCVYVFMDVCMYICMYVYMYICMEVWYDMNDNLGIKAWSFLGAVFQK